MMVLDTICQPPPKRVPGVRLGRAVLCNNCEFIVDVCDLKGCGVCPQCGSYQVSPLSAWVNRPDLEPERIGKPEVMNGKTSNVRA